MLARDEKLEEDVFAPVVPKNEEGFAELELVDPIEGAQLTARLTLADGKTLTLCDFASAGKDHEDHIAAVWFKTE